MTDEATIRAILDLPPSSGATPCEIMPQHRPAATLLRGVQRYLRTRNFESLAEFSLANGRRADVIAFGPSGEVWIVEIKSSAADFRADRKWPEYRDFCDQLLFAVSPDFPMDILPDETGLIVADGYMGDVIRPGVQHPIGAARRKALLLGFARAAAMRLQARIDPGQHFE